MKRIWSGCPELDFFDAQNVGKAVVVLPNLTDHRLGCVPRGNLDDLLGLALVGEPLRWRGVALSGLWSIIRASKRGGGARHEATTPGSSRRGAGRAWEGCRKSCSRSDHAASVSGRRCRTAGSACARNGGWAEAHAVVVVTSPAKAELISQAVAALNLSTRVQRRRAIGARGLSVRRLVCGDHDSRGRLGLDADA